MTSSGLNIIGINLAIFALVHLDDSPTDIDSVVVLGEIKNPSHIF